MDLRCMSAYCCCMSPKSSMYDRTVEQNLGRVCNDLERFESSLEVVSIIMSQGVHPSLQFLRLSAWHCHGMKKHKPA